MSKKPKIKRLTADEWAAARAAWEADPTLSFGELSSRLGISRQSVSRKAARDDWQRPTNLAELAKRAHARADEMAATEADAETEKGAEGDKVTTSSPSEGAEDVAVTLDKKTSVDRRPMPKPRPKSDPAVVQENAVRLRAEINDRHRKEWNAARQLSYEAIKNKDFERAKLAKITSETIRIIQDGERKAWGLDAADAPATPPVVVIERSGAGGCK